MNNGDFFKLIDTTMRALIDAYENGGDGHAVADDVTIDVVRRSRRPGADETPPRNVRCGRCKQWLTDAEWKYAPPRPIHDNYPGAIVPPEGNCYPPPYRRDDD